MLDPNTSKIRKDIEDIQGSGFVTADDSLVHAGLKKVQRGELSMSASSDNATIPIAVDMDKTFLNFSFSYSGGGADNDTATQRIIEASKAKGKITSTTNIAFSRSNSDGSVAIAWEVIEWK